MTRYRDILDTLQSRLASGAYPIGAHLPTEEEFCAEFHVSRHTVREAMRRLVEQGMVSRRQKHGTVVTAAAPRRGFVQTVASIADLFQFAIDTHYEVLDMRMSALDAATAGDVGGVAGERWLRVAGVRRVSRRGEVICTTVSFIPERLAWIEPELPGCVGPFYALIERRAGEAILDAVQEIRAERMPPELADILHETKPATALRLLRRYSSAKGTVIASYNWHPAESFTYRMRLRRTDAA